MLRLVITFALLRLLFAQVSCPGLGDFNPDGAFEGWPDPTCPGDSGMDLEFKMFGRLDLIGRTFDRNTVPPVFRPTLRTVFLIHGHESNKDDPWLSDMTDALTDAHNLNVVIVGWGGNDGAEDTDYWRAASDTRTVGAELAEVLMNLDNSGGGNYNNMHVVGHGLGAHVAGHAGRWAASHGMKPHRVTGLDPAGQHFIDNANRSVGLYNDCSTFVDVIHTNDVYGSTPTPGGSDVFLGDYDFFPNGGASQPGCGSSDLCSHDRAYVFFKESITNNCMEAEMKCTNSAQIPDSCEICETCMTMGYEGGNMGNVFDGRYYLTASADPPYC